jgi:hypothetical protein
VLSRGRRERDFFQRSRAALTTDAEDQTRGAEE